MGRKKAPRANPGKSKSAPKKRKRLTPIKWAMLRDLWESGQYTFRALAEAYGVSVDTIKHRSSKERWVAGRLKDVVEEAQRDNTIALLAKLGMPKEELLKLYVEGATATETLHNVKNMLKDDATGEVITEGKRPVVVTQTIKVIDHATRLKYRERLARIMGLDAAPKAAVKAKESDAVRPIPVINQMPDLAENNQEPKKPDVKPDS